MIEVKSATRLKEYHLQDIAIQGWVAEGAGVALDGLSVAVIDTDYVYPGGADYRGLLREIPVADQARPLMSHIPGWVRGFNELLGGPLPVRRTGTQCRRPFECPFVAFCEGQEGKSRCDPGEERDEDGACALPPDPALGTLDPAATAFLATLPYPRYYLDFETVQFAVPVWPGTSPFQQVVFQWSCHVEERPGEVGHREFLDTSGEAPMRQGAEALLEALGDQGPIFVYHDFEKWRIMEMAAMLPDLAPALNAVAGRLIDLLRLTRDHYEHPALNGSYSLKTVLPTVDAELDHALLTEVQDGLSAQAAYHEAVDPATPADRRDVLRTSLLEYCGLDTLALVRVAHRFATADGAVTHLTDIDAGGLIVPTLADILPEKGGLRALFVGKTPSPASVEVGHYFEGKMGKGLWKRLGDAGILSAPAGGYADDELLGAGFGVTDLCKVPRPFGDEPGREEYEAGWERVAGIVGSLRPRILVFVYKGSLDKVLHFSFGWEHKSCYGFNDDLARTFGRKVFAFPLPGVSCTAREAQRHMTDLAQALEVL